jgi:plastocyanin
MMTINRSHATRLAHLANALTCAMALGITACGGGGGGSPTSSTGSQTIASVSVSGNVTSVAVGASVQLSAGARNSAGTTVSATIAWASSNPAIATVGSSTGVVAGVALGNATITASAGGFSGTRVISVTNVGGGGAPPPASAQITMPGESFEPNAVTIAQGGIITWVFTALGHNVVLGAGSGAQDIGVTTNASVARTFNTKGTFSMVCTLHSGMSGTITVQ